MAHPPLYPTSPGKVCPGCHVHLPWDAFTIERRARDGHHRLCRRCLAVSRSTLMGARETKPEIVLLDDVVNAHTLPTRLSRRTARATQAPNHLRGTPYDIPCLLWTGGTSREGVGLMELRVAGRIIHLPVPRVVMLLRDGRTPPRSLVVMHRCDNPPCCEIEHLVVGSQQENIQDCQRKGRGLRGTRHPLCKLSDDDVREVRRLFQCEHVSCNHIAAMYGVHKSLVWLIVKGKHRAEVT